MLKGKGYLWISENVQISLNWVMVKDASYIGWVHVINSYWCQTENLECFPWDGNYASF